MHFAGGSNTTHGRKRKFKHVAFGCCVKFGSFFITVRLIMVYLWADHVTGNADSPIIIDSGLPCSVLHGYEY